MAEKIILRSDTNYFLCRIGIRGTIMYMYLTFLEDFIKHQGPALPVSRLDTHYTRSTLVVTGKL